MRCWKCKSEMPEGLKYCGNCGVHMNRAVYIFQWLFSKKGLPVVIGALVLALVATGVMLIRHYQESAETGLSVQEAQERMDEVLAAVFQEVSADNFIAQQLNGNVKIKVVGVNNTESGCVAECRVTSLDIATPLLNFIQAVSAGDTDSYINVAQNLQNEILNAQKMEASFEVEFALIEGKYTPVIPEEMMAFCNGNIQELLPLLYEILQGGAGE